MENVHEPVQHDKPLFALTIEPITKLHLADAAKWARFISVVGYIFLGLSVAGMLFSGASYLTLLSGGNRYGSDSTGILSAAGIAGMVGYLFVVVLIFFAYLYLHRFGTRMRLALKGEDQQMFNLSCQSLKVLFRYVGILIIIGLVLFALTIGSALLFSRTYGNY
jgi:hypothetical protein